MTEDFQFIENTLRDRLRLIDSRSDAGNGTLLADATATLLAADAVTARARAARVAALSDDVLQESITTVQLLLSAEERADAVLPFGTVAVTNEAGSVMVAEQVYVLVAQHEGMLREELAPRRFEGANLELLLRLIERRSKRLACRYLGRPTPVAEGGLYGGYWLQFAPCTEAGDVCLEVPLGDRPVAWMTHARLITLADDVVWAMRRFWVLRKRTAGRALQGASVFLEVVQAVGPEAKGLALCGVAAQPIATTTREDISLHLLVTTLDEALRPTVARWPVFSGRGAPDMLLKMIRQHSWDVRRVAMRTVVEMDELAAAIAGAAPEGTAAVLRRLATDLATDVVLPLTDRRSLVARLHWSEGMIVAHLFATQRVAFGKNSLLIFDGEWPETIADSVVGKDIGGIVDLPMHCPFPIRRAARVGARGLRLDFHTGVRPVDMQAGTIGSPSIDQTAASTA